MVLIIGGGIIGLSIAWRLVGIGKKVVVIDKKNLGKIKKKLPNLNNYNVILFCVGHSYYKNIRIKKLPKKPIYFDLNRVLSFSQIKLIKKRKLKLEILGGNY